MIERTLVLIKPDGVQRSLIGKIIQRFEDAGLKIVGMKMKWADEDFARKHYFDVEQRHGKTIFEGMVKNITEGPVIAIVVEGLHAVEIVRKIVGPTEPKNAPPGTIRGDFASYSIEYADKTKKAIKNVVHASSSAKDATIEIPLWFDEEEIYNYSLLHERHTM